MTLSDFIARHRAPLLGLADRPGCAASPRWTQLLLHWFAAAATDPDTALSERRIRPVLLCLARLLLCECTFITGGEGAHTHVVPVPAGSGHGHAAAAIRDLLACLAARDPELAGTLSAEIAARIRADFAAVDSKVRAHPSVKG